MPRSALVSPLAWPITWFDSTMRWSVLVFKVAALTFVGMLVLAAMFLPDPVAVFRAPAEKPDVMYRLWQFLTLAAIGAVIGVLVFRALARGLGGLVEVFVSRSDKDRTNEAANWVSAWLLFCSSVLIGVTMWFGNTDNFARSLTEWLTGLATLAGIPVVTVLALRAR